MKVIAAMYSEQTRRIIAKGFSEVEACHLTVYYAGQGMRNLPEDHPWMAADILRESLPEAMAPNYSVTGR